MAATSTPSRIFVVSRASAARSVQASRQLRSGGPRGRPKKWSLTQNESKLDFSAPCARSRISVYDQPAEGAMMTPSFTRRCYGSGGEPAPEEPRDANDREREREGPRDRGDERRVEIRTREERVEEDRGESDVARAVDPLPERVVHPLAQPAGHGDDDEDVEGERAEADLPPGVIDLEGHEDVAERDTCGLVENKRDHVRDHERDPQPRREVMELADRAVRGEEVEHRGSQGLAGDDRQRDRGEGRESRRARREPETEIVQGYELCVSVTLR